MNERAEPEAVEDRQYRQHRVALGHLDPGRDLHALADEVVVREHDPLRLSGRAARVEERGELPRRRRRRRCRRVLLSHQLRPPADALIRRDARDLAPACQPERGTLHDGEVVRDPRQDDRLERRPRFGLGEAVVERVERQGEA